MTTITGIQPPSSKPIEYDQAALAVKLKQQKAAEELAAATNAQKTNLAKIGTGTTS